MQYISTRGEVDPIGSKRPSKVDVRIISATNRNLADAVKAGTFREDLYYRLNVFPLHLDSLRERPLDIEPLARLAIEQHCTEKARQPVLTDDALGRLRSHTWPGNVRELNNLIQRSLILLKGSSLSAADLLFEDDQTKSMASVAQPDDATHVQLQDKLKHSEQQIIVDTLAAHNGNRQLVAKKLGISPRTLRYKLARMREQGVCVSRSADSTSSSTNHY